MDITRKQNKEGSVFKVSENKWISKICLGTAPDGKAWQNSLDKNLQMIYINNRH